MQKLMDRENPNSRDPNMAWESFKDPNMEIQIIAYTGTPACIVALLVIQ